VYWDRHYTCNANDIYYNHNPSIDHWFTIDIIDRKKIVFSVSKNESGKEREAYVALDPLNCEANIKIIQSVE
jgi:hypothetical protein